MRTSWKCSFTAPTPWLTAIWCTPSSTRSSGTRRRQTFTSESSKVRFRYELNFHLRIALGASLSRNRKFYCHETSKISLFSAERSGSVRSTVPSGSGQGRIKGELKLSIEYRKGAFYVMVCHAREIVMPDGSKDEPNCYVKVSNIFINLENNFNFEMFFP